MFIIEEIIVAHDIVYNYFFQMLERGGHQIVYSPPWLDQVIKFNIKRPTAKKKLHQAPQIVPPALRVVPLPINLVAYLCCCFQRQINNLTDRNSCYTVNNAAKHLY